MRSAIFEGRVQHHRHSPRPHAFGYRLFMMYLDLDELPTLFRGRWLWSNERLNLACFRRADYFGPPERDLREAVLDRVEQELGARPDGAVRVLTHMRTLGFVFNPVSFYFCFDAAGRLQAILSEITNTPWGERHAYVMDARRYGEGEAVSARFPKAFHVSPFHGMEQEYEWRFQQPGERLEVQMKNREGGELVFEAGLSGQLRPIRARSLALALLRHPLMTLRIPLAIYWQAARLFLLRSPFHTHPDKPAPEATV